MIKPIRHFALTAHRTVYDEEALSSLELMGRIGAKLNEIVEAVNEVNALFEDLPNEVDEALSREIANGNIAAIVGAGVLNELGESIDAMNRRINQIVASSGNDNTEVVDARSGLSASYESLGQHIRAIADGSAFSDAVRPGTVAPGRIMAGMMGGSMADVHTVQHAVSMAGKWGARAGYYDKATRNFVGHAGYNVSYTIPAKYGDAFVLKSYLFGNKVYPVAVLSQAGAVLEVIGTPGKSSWEAMDDAVIVSHPQAAFVQFITGVGYESSFRAYRVSANQHPVESMGASGYLHMIAKKRTDTVTDRAQIKAWFKLPEGRSADDRYTIPVQLYGHDNLAGYTFRVFAATSETSYDQSLSESAAGYTFDPSKGLEVSFKVPLITSAGAAVTHVCLFVDFLPVVETDPMDVRLPLLSMNGSEGFGYALHGAVNTDMLCVVAPGANGSPLYGKTLLGVGDSLMRGNNLPVQSSWLNIMAGRYDMTFRNAAVNGESVANMADKIDGYLTEFPSPDYFVLNGGANDLRLSVSLATFKEAITAIVGKVKANNPRCKILALTNWQRSPYENSLGLIESDYVEAMLETCEGLNVPCLNNYADSLNLTDPATQSWADEGTVTDGTANLHFSEEANRHLVPRIAAALEAL